MILGLGDLRVTHFNTNMSQIEYCIDLFRIDPDTSKYIYTYFPNHRALDSID